MRAKYIQKHEKIVNNHQGGFVKIYPNEYSDEYDHLIEGN